MVETPLGVINAAEIAALAAAPRSRLACFVMGTIDLAKETLAAQVPGRFPMLPWLSHCVIAARAYGIDILDGVYNDLADIEGFRRECVQGADMGFDGKTLIHPNQIEPCNAAFSPTPTESICLPDHRCVRLAGEPQQGRCPDRRPMVERLHAEMARRTVAIAEAIAARDK